MLWGKTLRPAPRVCTLVPFIRPSIEYSSEVWESNKGQTNPLESVVLGGAKKSLGALLKHVMKQLEGTWA